MANTRGIVCCNGGTGMTLSDKIIRGLPLAAVLMAALALGACANNPADEPGQCCGCRGAGQPAGLRRQCRRPRLLRDRLDGAHAAGAAPRSTSRRSGSANYNHYTFTIEGHADERGTREYNIALGARRAQVTRDYLVVARHPGAAHAHDLLRQGAAGRGLQRHFLLVAESPRRDGAERRVLIAVTISTQGALC